MAEPVLEVLEAKDVAAERAAACGVGPMCWFEGGRLPSDALGLVRELRVRDWMTAEGEVTLAGRNALRRWLDAADRA